MKRHILVVSSITPKGPQPQFYGEFDTKQELVQYERMWKNLVATAGLLVRFDRSLKTVSGRRSA